MKISPFFFKWAPFWNLIFKKEKNYVFPEVNDLNFTKKTQFCMRQLHFNLKQGETRISSGPIPHPLKHESIGKLWLMLQPAANPENCKNTIREFIQRVWMFQWINQKKKKKSCLNFELMQEEICLRFNQDDKYCYKLLQEMVKKRMEISYLQFLF